MIPQPGVWVTTSSDEGIGVVQPAHNDHPGDRVRVRWEGGRETLEHVSRLEPGLTQPVDVLHRPPGSGRKGFGHGTILGFRTIGRHKQCLVDFWLSNERHWLPWQVLVPVPPLKHIHNNAQYIQPHGERLRFRNLAFALERWQARTGSLSKLDIDPLPHQIHVAHTILTSGNLNWMIADDVGLGKTVEVGLIVRALMAQHRQRFLFVVPAGLTLQWQEELRSKFDIDDAVVYGSDFTVDTKNPAQWKLYDRVIVSIDRIKAEPHLRSILAADRWDLAIFDEAHRLTRADVGNTVKSSLRYQAARAISKQSDAVLLLTGTPHQGKSDRFRALLELLRPGNEWKGRLASIESEPEVLRELIVRNRKADVIDGEGRFIFHGKDVRTVEVPADADAITFERALRSYIKQGYRRARGNEITRRAIGFVMTTYRKLAASSYAAIERALTLRQARLHGTTAQPSNGRDVDDRYVETDELVLDRIDGIDATQEFFEGERDQLRRLIEQAKHLKLNDTKRVWLMDQVLNPLLASDPSTKVLIFTEYRTTQSHLENALRDRYGSDSVSRIHGGQTLKERSSEIENFQADGRFMISTEAGAEGLNLQQGCHIMVNYDLPWNPMRLVQRVGRLYRYGQPKRVQVINLRAPSSADEDILGKIYERLEQVARDLASVSDFGDGKAGLQEDILGDLIGNLDVGVDEILTAADGSEERSLERVNEAMERARDMADRQNDLLRFATAYNPEDLRRDLPLGTDHVKAFARLGLTVLDGEVALEQYGGDVWQIRLPEETRRGLKLKASDRLAFTKHAAKRAGIQAPFGPDHPLFTHLHKLATHYDEQNLAAHVGMPGVKAALAALLRVLDESSRTARTDYAVACLMDDGSVVVNPQAWTGFLLEGGRALGGLNTALPETAWAELTQALEEAAHQRLANGTHPDAPYPVGFVWSESH